MPAIPPNYNPPRPGTKAVVNTRGLPPPPPPQAGGPAWGVQGQHPGDQGSGVYYYNSSPMAQQEHHPSGPGGIVRGVAMVPDSHTSAQHRSGWEGESVVSGTFPTTSSATSRSHSNDPWQGGMTPPRNRGVSSSPAPNTNPTTPNPAPTMVRVPASEVNGYAEMFGLHIDIVKKVMEREQGDRDRTLAELERLAARINNNNASPPRDQTTAVQGPYTGGYGAGANSVHGRYGPAGPAFIPSANAAAPPQVGVVNPHQQTRSPAPRPTSSSAAVANVNPVQVDTILSVLTGSPSTASPQQRRIVASALNRSDGDVHRATNELLETGALFINETSQSPPQSSPQGVPQMGAAPGGGHAGGGGLYGSSPSSSYNPPPTQHPHQSAEDRLIREFTSCSLDDIKNALNLTDDDEQQARLYLTNVVLLERRDAQLRAAQHPSSMSAFSSVTNSTATDSAIPTTWLNRARAMQQTHSATPNASPVVSSTQQPIRPLPTLPEGEGEFSDFSASWRRTGLSAPSPPSAHRDPSAAPPTQQAAPAVVPSVPASGVTAVAPKGVAPPPPPKGKVPPPSKQPPPAAGGVPPLALNTMKATTSVPPVPIGPPKGAPPPPPGGKAGPKGPPPPLPPKKGVPPLPPMGGKKQPAAASGEAEKTRKLFWQKLSTDAVSLEKTVWGAATPRGAMTPRMGSAASSSPQSNNPESIESVLSREEKGRLEEIFAKKPVGGPGGGGAQGKAAPVAAVRSVLDANRDKNVGIVLQFLRLPLDRIKTSVLAMSDSEGSMGADAVSGLLSIVPTPEDMKAVDRYAPLLLSDAKLSACPTAKKNAKGDWEIDGVSAAQLSSSARFFIMTKSVPRFEQRLQCWDTMLTLEAQVAELAKYMEVAVEAMAVPVGSEQFPVVLQFILSVGTFLNTGATNGDASAGFRMSDLPKITSFKTSDNKGTMLSYLVDLVDRKNPEAHGFVQELEGLVRVTGSASTLVQIDIPQFKQQLSSLETALSRCEGLLQALTRDLGDRDPVVVSLGQWLEKHGRPSVAAIKDHRLPATLDAAKELAEYFGEDVDGIVNATTSEGARQLQDLLKHIGNFSRDYGFELQKTREKAQRMGRQQQQQSTPPQPKASSSSSPSPPQPRAVPAQSRVVVPPSAVRREEAVQRQTFMDML